VKNNSLAMQDREKGKYSHGNKWFNWRRNSQEKASRMWSC
jgi:hypothetical protein